MKKTLERQLIEYTTESNLSLFNQILELKKQSVLNKNEIDANYYWLLEHIYNVKSLYHKSFELIKENEFEKAWNDLDRCDITIGELLENADESWLTEFGIIFIKEQIHEFQKLFPYFLFISREAIIKREICSICGQEIKLRGRCEHKIGKLYMGDICSAIVIDAKVLSFSIVTNPFDKCCILKCPDVEYNYSILKEAITKISNPYRRISVIKDYVFKENLDQQELIPHTFEWLRQIERIEYSLIVDNNKFVL